MALPPRPQRIMAADTDSLGTPTRHTAGTDGARPKHGALARREYGLLAPTGTAVNTAAAGDQGSRDGHKATRGTANQARRETGEGGGTRQRAFPACSMRGVNNEGRRPPKQSRTLNACGRQGGWGGIHPAACAHVAQLGTEGGTLRHGSARP